MWSLREILSLPFLTSIIQMYIGMLGYSPDQLKTANDHLRLDPHRQRISVVNWIIHKVLWIEIQCKIKRLSSVHSIMDVMFATAWIIPTYWRQGDTEAIWDSGDSSFRSDHSMISRRRKARISERKAWWIMCYLWKRRCFFHTGNILIHLGLNSLTSLRFLAAWLMWWVCHF